MAEQCVPCSLKAGALVLVKTYCKKEKQECEKILDEFGEGDMTLKQLAKKVKADPKFLDFLEKETKVDLTLNKSLEKEV